MPEVGLPISDLRPLLTVTERAALLECESIIRAGRQAFIQVGHALTRIRDSRLYREQYSTFEDYCLDAWEISDRYARNMRSAADVVDVLQEKQFAVLPASESQARPLTKLPREEWSPAWDEVVGTAPAGRVTANHVAIVVQRRINRLAGISTDTEVLQKTEVRSQKSDGGPLASGLRPPIDAGTRDERIMAAHVGVLEKLAELQDLMRGDGAAMHVSMAVNSVNSSRDHFEAVRRLKGHVEKSQGLRPEYAKRAGEQKGAKE